MSVNCVHPECRNKFECELEWTIKVSSPRLVLNKDTAEEQVKKNTTVVCEGVTWEMLGFTERKPGTPVHLRDDRYERCKACGSYGGVWTDGILLHRLHVDSCLKTF